MTQERFRITRPPGMLVSDDDLLADLRATAERLGKTTLGMKEYRRFGKHNDVTVSRRFGTWNKALEAAGLAISKQVNIPTEQLFENILSLWQHHGRQPTKRQLSQPPSLYSERPYTRRFGSWWKALEAFVEYANQGEDSDIKEPKPIKENRRGSRDPSLRLRWKVLKRDRFSCKGCGASPALNPGTELHVDHVMPWSKGGETVLENLQTLCSTCNFGKSNL